MAAIGVIGMLGLVDVCSDGPVRIVAPSASAHGGNHVVGRALLAADHVGGPEAEWFLFDLRFTGYACVVVFERAFIKPTAFELDELVRHVEFLDTPADYGIALTEPSRSQG